LKIPENSAVSRAIVEEQAAGLRVFIENYDAAQVAATMALKYDISAIPVE